MAQGAFCSANAQRMRAIIADELVIYGSEENIYRVW